jgi:hypothetical protein
LSQPQLITAVSSTQIKLREEPARRNCSSDRKSSVSRQTAPTENSTAWNTEAMLDTTYNRLQELMQLLYLLGRDPAVPTDARYHVTVAQSEIALLTRMMHNSAHEEATGCPRPPA